MSEPTIDSSDVKYGIVETVARLREPLLRRLHDDWQAAAAAGLPGHDFLDPQRLGYVADALVVLDAVSAAGRMRYRYRSVGAEVAARRGRDRSGSWIDEHEEGVFARLGPRVCDFVRETRRPVYVDLRRRIDSRYYALELLMLPLADAAGDVDCILTAQIYPADAPRQVPLRG